MTNTYDTAEPPAKKPRQLLTTQRKGTVREPMDDNRFEAIVHDAISDAEAYIDDYIAPERDQAAEYFAGKPLGNEVDGRSRIVMTEVHDVVMMLMPGLMRVFAGQQEVVEFEPTSEEDVEYAKQATQYIDHVFMKDNPGFMVIYETVHDGLVRKMGIFKWWWDRNVQVFEQEFQGLVPQQFAFLANQKGVEILDAVQDEDGNIDCQVRVTRDKGCVKVASIPPEEFIISRDATSVETAACVGHRREMTVSDLVEMGYDYEEVIANLDAGWADENMEKLTRNPAEDDPNRFSADPAMRKTKYTEALVRVDRDGDGYAELLKVCTISDAFKILHVEAAEDVNFSIWSPAPEPHMVVGKSMADETMDLQRAKSQLMRFTLDGLAQSITPRTAYDYTTVNGEDLASNAVGAQVRVKGPPGDKIMPIATVFPADQAMAMLQYLDEVKASRTGVSKASQGLDIDALNQATATAVNATVSAAEMRQEVIARFYANALASCFKGILKLTKRYQDVPRTIRLRNKFVAVDPSPWNVDMDVTPNVGIGTNNRQDRGAVYFQVAGKQQEIIEKLGPDNALCDLGQLRNTYASILQLVGERDITRFFKEVTPQGIQQTADMMQQAAQQNGQQGQGGMDPQAANKLADAEMAKAQASMQKAQADTHTAETKPQLDAAKALSDDDFRRDQLEGELIIKCIDVGVKNGMDPAGIIQFVSETMARNRANQPLLPMFDITGPPPPPPAPAPPSSSKPSSTPARANGSGPPAH